MKCRGMFTVAFVASAFLAVSTQHAAAEPARTCNGVAATIVGTPGDDDIRGTDAADVIVALDGADQILGFGGDDIICAGTGNDYVQGGEGFDLIFGAQGNDLLFSAGNAANSGLADFRGARMFGGAGNDTLHGSDRWDRMQGGDGNDIINGYGGQDWIRGGAGDDVIDGGLGTDDMRAGRGADTLVVTNGDVARGGTGFDRCVPDGILRARGVSCVESSTPEPLMPGEFRYFGPDYQASTGRFLGIVEGALNPGSKANGSCYFVLAEMTLGPHPFFITAPPTTLPSIGAIGAQSANGRCDHSAAVSSGYFFLPSANMVPGSTFSFFVPVFVPEGTPAPRVALLFGVAEPLRFPVRGLSELPTAPGSIAKAPSGNQQAFNANSSFRHVGNGEVWTGDIDSFAVVENLSDQHNGQCIVIRGEITAVSTSDGEAADTPPTVAGFANGVRAPSVDFCDTSDAIADGYPRLARLEVPVGRTRRFHTSIFVPAQTRRNGGLSHLTIGGVTTSATVMALS